MLLPFIIAPLVLLAIEPALPVVLELHLRGSLHAQGSEPETALRFDESAGPLIAPDTPLGAWRVDELLLPRQDQAYGGVAVSMMAEWEPHRWLMVRTWLDSGLIRPGSSLEPAQDGASIDGATAGRQLGTGAFIREFSMVLGPPAVNVELGRRRSRVAEGLIFDDFGTGAHLVGSLEAMRGHLLRLEASVFAVERDFENLFSNPSPLVLLTMDWEWSLFESVGIFAAEFRDHNGQIRNILASAIGERIIMTETTAGQQEELSELFVSDEQRGAEIGYLGLRGNLLVAGGTSLRVVGAISRGSGTVVLNDLVELNERERYDLTLGGWAAAAETHTGLGERFDLGLTGFALSGDFAPTNDNNYNAFIGVAPLWTWTGLFFSGGITQGFYAGRTMAAGVNGHGVFGGGPVLSWLGDDLFIEGRAIWLQAPISSPSAFGGGGHIYGLETDLVAEWRVHSWLQLMAEIDVLFPGNFFPQGDIAHRVILLLDVNYAI